MNIPGDNRQHYLPRMQWYPDGNRLLVQQLNRKQNHMRLWQCDISTAEAINIYSEQEEAWIDVVDDWLWLDDGQQFAWTTEKDGWRHLYTITSNGKKESLITKGDYDVIEILEIDTKNDYCYFIASPDNPTQRYLYRIPIGRNGKLVRLSPVDQSGWHSYSIAPGGAYAFHTFSNINTPPITELVRLPDHKQIKLLIDNAPFRQKIDQLARKPYGVFPNKNSRRSGHGRLYDQASRF